MKIFKTGIVSEDDVSTYSQVGDISFEGGVFTYLGGKVCLSFL